MTKTFSSLSENEVLALAVTLEEGDARIYGDYAERLKATYPETARMLRTMQEEEMGHAQSLREAYRVAFGDHIPFIQRQEVKGFIRRKPSWLTNALTLSAIRKEVEVMEIESMRFYQTAAQRATNPAVRELLLRLAEAEKKHEDTANHLAQDLKESGALKKEDEASRRVFVLQIVQPGLAGLMDGSVSTLAPVFAAAFATHSSRDAFVVGLAASVGAGISMGFAECLSDDGVLSGRGRPLIRGIVCGLMTALGGIGHTLPFLIPQFYAATAVAAGVVVLELLAISWIRHQYMDTPLLSAAFQVIVGGVIVFIAGILIGAGLG